MNDLIVADRQKHNGMSWSKLQGKGTGLGLAICRNIITEFFQGTMHVESQLGQGSTFILQLPRQRQRGAEAAESFLARYEQAGSAA